MSNFEFNSQFRCNALIWVNALPDDEQGPTRRILEDLEPLLTGQSIRFERHDVSSKADLTNLFADLASKASRGMKPIIHLDMHGSKNDGLKIAASGESYLWRQLYTDLQNINTYTNNNLIIFSGVCYSIYSINELNIFEPCPAYVYIAPQGPVSCGFLLDNTLGFYRDVFGGEDLIRAYETNLSKEMKFYHCEKLFFIAIAEYIKKYCYGSGVKKRREELLTKLFASGRPKTKKDLRYARNFIKEKISHTQELIDRYAAVHLVGRQFRWKLYDVLLFIRSPHSP